MNIGDLLGSVLQSGVSQSTTSRIMNSLGGVNLGGNLGGLLNEVGKMVGGNQNLALGGLGGALAGAILGGKKGPFDLSTAEEDPNLRQYAVLLRLEYAVAMAGVGLVHAMSYPLGGMFGIPHGLANAVLLPYVTEYNLMGNLEKYTTLAALLGYETDRMPLRESAMLAVEGLFHLNADLDIPETLADLGISEEKIPEMADIALTVARPIENNPRRPSREDIIAVYEYAMNG